MRDTNFGTVTLFAERDIDALAALQGNTWDRSLGLLLVSAVDCRHAPAAGVAWEPNFINVKTKRFYFVNGIPDEAATATDGSGLGGLVNSPPGNVTVRATLQATGTRIGSATAMVRSGSMTYVVVPPTP
jgi:hypothetical protein